MLRYIPRAWYLMANQVGQKSHPRNCIAIATDNRSLGSIQRGLRELNAMPAGPCKTYMPAQNICFEWFDPSFYGKYSQNAKCKMAKRKVAVILGSVIALAAFNLYLQIYASPGFVAEQEKCSSHIPTGRQPTTSILSC